MTPLSEWQLDRPATIARIDWTRLGEPDGRRLRELGLIEGVRVEPLHRGSLFSPDPVAVRVGRMDVIIRMAHAGHIMLHPVDEDETAGLALAAE